METKRIILLVEDELAQRVALRDKLRKEGFGILEAKNGEEGLASALKDKPDLILLDIMMPKMDGLEMARRLRQDEWGKHAKVVILTNSPDMENIRRSLEDEVFEYFVKSDTKIEYIIDRIKKIVK